MLSFGLHFDEQNFANGNVGINNDAYLRKKNSKGTSNEDGLSEM